MQRGGRPGLGALAGPRDGVYTQFRQGAEKRQSWAGGGSENQAGKDFSSVLGGEALSRRPSFCTPSSGCLSISVFPLSSLLVPTLPWITSSHDLVLHRHSYGKSSCPAGVGGACAGRVALPGPTCPCRAPPQTPNPRGQRLIFLATCSAWTRGLSEDPGAMCHTATSSEPAWASIQHWLKE